MKRGMNVIGLLSMLGLCLCAMSAPALAQNGGGGGGNSGGGGGNAGGGGNSGGVARHGGNFNIIWDTPQPINGRTPKALGSVNISTYVAVINMDVRLSSVNLPDNTELKVTVYAKDFFTGLPWITKDAGTITLVAQKGALTVNSLWVTAPGFLPVVTNVVVTQADGTVVASGHP